MFRRNAEKAIGSEKLEGDGDQARPVMKWGAALGHDRALPLSFIGELLAAQAAKSASQ